MTTRRTDLREARPEDAAALAALERDANLVALGHVFPPDRFPFPLAQVQARWESLLEDPTVRLGVMDGPGRLEVLVAHDDEVLRHLAVHPERWGCGWARRAVVWAVAGIRRREGTPRLWVLRENERARSLYRHLGWVPMGQQQQCEWPPHPVELEHRLPPGTAIRD